MSEEVHEPLAQQGQALGLGRGKILDLIRKFGPDVAALILKILGSTDGGTPPPAAPPPA